MKSVSTQSATSASPFEHACRNLVRSIISDLGKGRPVANYNGPVDQAIAEAQRRGLTKLLEHLESAKRCIVR